MDRRTWLAALAAYRAKWGRDPGSAAYAPGRVEVLGNHTDYNEGLVLSAAIDYGTFFLASRAPGTTCTLVAADVNEEVSFDAARPAASTAHPWSNYVKGVYAGLRARGVEGAFNGLFLGNVPVGSGLSSSAALEMSAGLALAACFGIEVDRKEMARIGQKAEHDYAGVKCGLLDQISSLFAREHHLVMSDFRSLDIAAVPLGDEACFVVCDSGVRHTLADGAYNERRHACEAAAAYFASALPHPVRALRDVSWAEWEAHAARMDPLAAKRSAHPIGETERVLRARDCLAGGDLAAFGALMYASHESSIRYFENSCEELDMLVGTARKLPGVLGARLSGGGFGGSVVVLAHPRDAETVAHALSSAYGRRFGRECESRLITPSAGAQLIEP